VQEADEKLRTAAAKLGADATQVALPGRRGAAFEAYFALMLFKYAGNLVTLAIELT
jgi:hypothetical protein